MILKKQEKQKPHTNYEWMCEWMDKRKCKKKINIESIFMWIGNNIHFIDALTEQQKKNIYIPICIQNKRMNAFWISTFFPPYIF